MPSKPIPCVNCGAQLVPQADGRTHRCEYCGAQVQVAVESQQIAAGLRLDLTNMEAFLTHLAHTLSTGYGEWTRVQANGPTVHSVEVTIEPDVFVAKREPRGVVAQHRKVVRGIALRTETHPLDKWVDLLTAALARHANTNAQAAQVLARLGGNGPR